MIIEAREGVGLNRLQLTTRISMSFGWSLFLFRSPSIVLNITAAASSLEDFIDDSNGGDITAGGRYVSWPNPDLAMIFSWKDIDSLLNF